MSSRWAYIRQAAAKARLAFAAATQQDLATVDKYVDVHVLAEDVFKLGAFLDNHLPEGVHAMLIPHKRDIRVRAGVSAEEERLLIAHELGHAVLENLAATVIDGPQHVTTQVHGLASTDQGVLRSYSTRERREQEANIFMLELLVPVTDLAQQLQQKTWDVTILAKRYGVSADAIHSQILNIALFPPLPASTETVPHGPTDIILDVDQQNAIKAPLPTLVIAGPGSGKTRCMVQKYTALLAAGVPPEHILALTFSNKAAEELRDRIMRTVPNDVAPQVSNIQVYTFHAFGLELLRRYHTHLALPARVPLLTRGDLFILTKQRLDDFPLKTRFVGTLQFTLRPAARNIVSLSFFGGFAAKKRKRNP